MAKKAIQNGVRKPYQIPEPAGIMSSRCGLFVNCTNYRIDIMGHPVEILWEALA